MKYVINKIKLPAAKDNIMNKRSSLSKSKFLVFNIFGSLGTKNSKAGIQHAIKCTGHT